MSAILYHLINIEKSSHNSWFTLRNTPNSIFNYSHIGWEFVRKLVLLKNKNAFNLKAEDIFLAESGGFEPADPLTSQQFKTAAIDHSANSPPQKYKLYLNLQTMTNIFFKKRVNALKQRDKKLRFL